MMNAVGAGTVHPLDVKKKLACHIVTEFHDERAAAGAQAHFEARYQQDKVPSGLQTRRTAHAWNRNLPHLLVDFGLCESVSEAQRQIKARAVSIRVGESDNADWHKITDPTFKFDVRHYAGKVVVFKVGRRPLVKAVLTTE